MSNESNKKLEENNDEDKIKYQKILNHLLENGIFVDRNLRQPTYYASITREELKFESFGIISELLTNQKCPLWLSQRIAWFYVSTNLETILNDLNAKQADNNDESNSEENEMKEFSREKLLIYLRESIQIIIQAWLDGRAKLLNEKNKEMHLTFSYNRFENDQNKVLKWDEYGIKNKRRVMEDKTSVFENLDFLLQNVENNQNKKRPDSIFCVMDGHCGVDCAQFVSTHLPISIIQHPALNESKKSYDEINSLVYNSFQGINQDFTQKALKENLKSGATCCFCLVYSNNLDKNAYTDLLVAWCGDTQFCLVKSGKLRYFSRPHKPEQENERKRIEAHGASVSFICNTWRVNGSLGVARAFGDIDYQSDGVICNPDIKNIQLDGTEDYFIIGCDGLWESLEVDELVSFVYENRNSNTNMSELLVRKAKENGSSDNITAIFVLLKDEMDQVSPPYNNGVHK